MLGDKLITKPFLLTKINEEIKELEDQMIVLQTERGQLRQTKREFRATHSDLTDPIYVGYEKRAAYCGNRLNVLREKIKKLKAQYVLYSNMNI